MNVRALVYSLVGLGVGIAAGRFLGGDENPSTAVTTAAQSSPSPIPVAAVNRPGTFIRDESPAITRVFSALHEAELDERAGLYEAVKALSPAEIEKVRESLKRMPASIASLLRPSLVEQWVVRNPSEAALRVREMPESGRFTDSDGIATAWAQANPELALAEAARLGDRSGKATFLRRAAIGALARHDPSLAMDQVEALRNSSEKDSLMASTAVELARKNPEAASTWLASRMSKLKIGAEGSQLVNQLLGSMAGKDPNRAKAELEKLPDFLRSSAAGAIGQELVYYDPRGGLDWCAKNGVFDNLSQERDSGAFESALSRDRESAIAWTLEQPEGKIRDYALANILQVSKNVGEVTKRFAMMSPEAQVNGVAQAVQIHANLGKFEDTLQWVESFADENVRQSATVALIGAKGGTDPERVMPLLERLPEGPMRDDGATNLFMYQDPSGPNAKNAEKLFSMISDPNKRQQAAQQGYFRIAYANKKEIAKADAWLDALPGMTPEQRTSIKRSIRFQ